MFFYGIAAFVLATAIYSVVSRNIFRSAIFLLFSLIGIAGIYLLLEVEFLAAVQTIVYVGGIVVLIIFSIFLTQQAGVKLPAPAAGRTAFSILAALSGFLLICTQLLEHPFQKDLSVAPSGMDVHTIGKGLLGTGDNGYALPFELISILLLAAMIGCIVIAVKPNPSEK
ncbi:MAG: NADH-quinone oxidoreductase subunit J [Bacteroidota bacterium]